MSWKAIKKQFFQTSKNFLIDQTKGEQLYLLALAVFMLSENLATTMFHVPGIVYLACQLTALGLLGIKVAFFDHLRMAELFIFVGLILEGILVYLASGYQYVLMWVLFVVAARNASFERILKVHFIVSLSVVLTAFIASNLDVIVNLQYGNNGGRGVRNSFGITYPTDFAAHIFFLTVTYLYLMRARLHTRYYIICAGIAWLVYYFCNARLDVSCMLIAILGYIILDKRAKLIPNIKDRYRRFDFISEYGVYSMPVAAVFMFLISDFYDPGNTFLHMLDQWLSGRLYLGKRGLTEYSVTLFGRYVEMIGNGSTTKMPSAERYFFVDCSYIYNFMRYGLIFLMIVLATYVICCKRYRMNHYFLLTIAVISLNCMISHHLIELAYNPFAFALLADKIDPEERQGRRAVVWRHRLDQ